MTKFRLSMVVFALSAGCSSPEASGGGSPTRGPLPETGEVGQVTQRSQLADSTVFNIVDLGTGAWLNMMSDQEAVTLQVFYIGDKTTASGHFPSTAVLVDTISLDPFQAKGHSLNLSHAAFAGGYGSLLVDAIGVSPTTVFQTYLTSQPGNVTQDVGGSVYQGSVFRIPVFRGSTNVVLAVTNQSDFATDVVFTQSEGPGYEGIQSLVPLSTYKFDSTLCNFTWPPVSAARPAYLQVAASQPGATLAVSGYVVYSNAKWRVAPVPVHGALF